MQGFWLVQLYCNSHFLTLIFFSKYTQEENAREQIQKTTKAKKSECKGKTPHKKREKLEFVRWLIEMRMPMSKKNQVGQPQQLSRHFSNRISSQPAESNQQTNNS